MGWFESKNGIIGDDPLDIIEGAIKRIRKSYKSEWKREATIAEVRDVFNYAMRPLERK